MTYELASKLKNAGFPQEVEYGSVVFSDGTKIDYNICDSDDMDKTTGGYNPKLNKESTTALPNITVSPTLSELIEACGDRFDCLRKVDNIWQCGEISMFEVWATISEGSNPKEAVAKLWLEINKE